MLHIHHIESTLMQTGMIVANWMAINKHFELLLLYHVSETFTYQTLSQPCDLSTFNTNKPHKILEHGQPHFVQFTKVRRYLDTHDMPAKKTLSNWPQCRAINDKS
ncbi:hypothetical protein M758_4G233400 [Ceratodon purpureus]|uniref:Uncharacterized protein n=1 Tax=Ceratodon purpureus TaxID=3225 RepID=A0A8T0IE67_CERPU|nr:hypothetical protein KC19_4G229500 [Ceratodon purpureus]KAG0620660.1 hypothetical protein M758_4G233400 [Ceratodon purpureus]